MLWWLDFRGEWRGCSRIGWLLCRNGCISECCHEIGLYCVHWSTGRVVLTWGRCWPLHRTGGAHSKTVASAVCRSVANFKRIDVFWLSKWFVARRRFAAACRRFGTAYLSHFQAPNLPLLGLLDTWRFDRQAVLFSDRLKLKNWGQPLGSKRLYRPVSLRGVTSPKSEGLNYMAAEVWYLAVIVSLSQNVHTFYGANPASYLKGTMVLSRRLVHREVKLTAGLRLTASVGISGAEPLPLCVHSWNGQGQPHRGIIVLI